MFSFLHIALILMSLKVPIPVIINQRKVRFLGAEELNAHCSVIDKNKKLEVRFKDHVAP